MKKLITSVAIIIIIAAAAIAAFIILMPTSEEGMVREKIEQIEKDITTLMAVAKEEKSEKIVLLIQKAAHKHSREKLILQKALNIDTKKILAIKKEIGDLNLHIETLHADFSDEGRGRKTFFVVDEKDQHIFTIKGAEEYKKFLQKIVETYNFLHRQSGSEVFRFNKNTF